MRSGSAALHSVSEVQMGWEIRPRGRQLAVVALVLSPVFLAAGLLVLFPLFIPRAWWGWVLAYLVGAGVVVAAVRSGRRD